MSPDDVIVPSGSGRIVLASCKADQLANETLVNGAIHGAFTGHLLDALDGRASDTNGVVTISRCFDYVARALSESKSQTPVMRGDQVGRIVLGRKDVTAPRPTEGTAESTESTVDQVAAQAKQYVETIFSIPKNYSHEDWLKRGHLEACQRIDPILSWFKKQEEIVPDLKRNRSFQESQESIFQLYRNLCGLLPGVVLAHGRTVGPSIGSGTFGTVWRIHSNDSESEICLKSYHPTELKDREKVARFERGFRAMKQLDHPNIVKVYDYSLAPLGFYMRFVEGTNFRLLNPSTALEPAQIVQLLLVVAETLNHAHGREVLHRDVKPENILLQYSADGEITPFLTDFDLAWFSSATQLTKLADGGFGSHFYAAPEQMNNPHSPGAHRSTVDTYSFGQVMFFGISGRDPAAFDSEGNIKALRTYLSNKWPHQKSAEKILNLYSNCTVRDPSKREGNFRSVSDVLSTVLLELRQQTAKFSATELLSELRYSIAGLATDDAQPSHKRSGQIEFRSPSKRTLVSVIIKLETDMLLTLEATFIPDENPFLGSSAAASRDTTNNRIAHALEKFTKAHDIRKSSGGIGYQPIVTFGKITLDPAGLQAAREIVTRVIDSIERV